jgi:hypothetical protein
MDTDAQPKAEAQDLQQLVEHEIRQRTWGRVRHLEVQRLRDHLIVQGSTPSYYVKQLVIQAVLDVIGAEQAPQVVFQLEVNDTPPAAAPESHGPHRVYRRSRFAPHPVHAL